MPGAVEAWAVGPAAQALVGASLGELRLAFLAACPAGHVEVDHPAGPKFKRGPAADRLLVNADGDADDATVERIWGYFPEPEPTTEAVASAAVCPPPPLPPPAAPGGPPPPGPPLPGPPLQGVPKKKKWGAVQVQQPEPAATDEDAHPMAPLTDAAVNGDCEKVLALLQDGADLEAADEFGYTALMGAAEWGKWEVLEALLAAGAQAEVKDLDGETALMWANNYTDNDPSGKCVAILEAAGA